ncbi:hypothetical protein M569_03192 [Genlisea aurea]|uniref:NADP-dependent oxidoreductase domain-containing protein n=1 Tax=Genlisea aurea TaxID=192259 RepID=S8E6U3_9LAMI|nr:hypothetical protein M569_03192 [Genlisea aurea]
MMALGESRVGRMKLGSQGLEVSKQGLGCMGMSACYGPPKPHREMIDLIRYAVDSGVTFLDTADAYGPHTNEILIGKALKNGYREKVELATKFSITRNDDGNMDIRGDPQYVRAACESSLRRLDVDHIDLYYAHRIDTRVPIEITMGELKKLVEEGKIKYVGLSEASASTIRRAHAVHPIAALQVEWSLWCRDLEPEIIPTCRELGIGIVPYSPLGQGFLSTGPKLIRNLPDGDLRKVSDESTYLLYISSNRLLTIFSKQLVSRFRGENVEHNGAVYERIREMGARKGCTPSQIALAWVHHQGEDVSPIPGTTKLTNLNENIGAMRVKLTQDEITELSTLVDLVKGDRNLLMNHTWVNANTPPLSSWKSLA